MTSWGELHAGDEVRGADGRAWTVTDRGVATAWLGTGTSDAPFRLRLCDREVSVRRGLCEPVELATPADHTAMAAACTALAERFEIDLLEETLSDPFTPPAVAKGRGVRRDRYGRYLLPDPVTGSERAWTRTTTLARTLADEYGLTRWKLRQVARGMALRPDLVAGAAAADPATDRSTLDDIASKAMERAGSSSGSTLGTALHNFTARLDRGAPVETLGVPDPLATDLAAYRDALGVHRLRVLPEYVERVVVLPELGVAGTLDRVVEQPPGREKVPPLCVADLKTGRDLSHSWLEIAIQLALYARATHMWDAASETYVPMPPVDPDRALVLHLPVGAAHGTVYAVDLIKGWTAAQLAVRVREARSGARELAWLVEPNPAEYALHRVARAGTQEELARLWDQLHPQGLWTEEVNAAAAKRWDEIRTPVAV